MSISSNLKIVIDEHTDKGLCNKLQLILLNKDTKFSSRIINEDINIKDLFYQINIYLLGDINEIIKSTYIPEIKKDHYHHKKRKINFDFSEALSINIEDLSPKILYNIDISLNEQKQHNYQFFNVEPTERILETSNSVYFNPKYGEFDKEKIFDIHKMIFSRKIFSKSEKETIDVISDYSKMNGLDGILSKKDVKKLTFENRGYGNIENFKNSNYKFSKLMDEKRQKKVIYSTNTILHFEEKFLNKVTSGEEISENPFLKNEWFMGPLYSYNYNYQGYNK
jgi:uncharacterized protein YfkK (UPF0435 family)